MSWFSNLLNPFSSRNPLRPDNLAKDPLGLNAQDLLTDAKGTSTGAVNADGEFVTPSTGYQKAYNAYLLNGEPGASGERGSSEWNNAFNAWAGKALELNGAYDAYDRGEVADPLDLWNDNWDFERVTNVANGVEDGMEEVPLEQDLADRTLADYINPALAKDKLNQAEFARILESYQPAIEANRGLVNDLSTVDESGRSRLALQELANLDATTAKMNAATQARLDANKGDIWGAYQERLRGANDLLAAQKGNLWGAYQERNRAADDLLGAQKENFWAAYQERNRGANDLLGKLLENTGVAYDAKGNAIDSRELEKLGSLDEAIAALRSTSDQKEGDQLGATKIALDDILAEAENRRLTKRASSVAAEGEQRAALGTALESLLGAADERKAQKLSDLDPLLSERLNAAEAQVTSASLGEQAARDKITADLAAQGFVGGSSFADANLARATVAARQAGAEAVGAAKIANESDRLAVNNEASNARYGSQTWGANEGYSLAKGASADRQSYDNEAGDARFNTIDWGAKRDVGIRDAAATERSNDERWGIDKKLGVRNEASDSRFTNDNWFADTNLGAHNENARTLNDNLVRISDQALGAKNANAESKNDNLLWISDEAMKAANAKAKSDNDNLLWISDEARAAKNTANDALWDTSMWGANQGLSYLDADTKRRLANLETPFSLAQSEASTINAFDNAGWAGLNRSLDALNWWKLSESNGGGNVSAAPNTVDTSGNWMSSIGPSMVNAGLGLGQANNWWQKPSLASQMQTKVPTAIADGNDSIINPVHGSG